MNDEDERSLPPRKAGKDPRKIESEIEETRAALGRSVDALGKKLTPEYVKEEAKEMLLEARDRGMQKARDLKEQASEAMTKTFHQAGDQARGAGNAGLEFVRDNAVPLSLIGLGVGLLFTHSRSRNAELGRREEREPHGFDATDTGGRIKNQIERTDERARKGLEDARNRTREFAADRPLALAAAAIIAGFGLGTLIPSTEGENRTLGGARDRLFGQAKGAFDEVREAVGDTAREVQNAASETAHH